MNNAEFILSYFLARYCIGGFRYPGTQACFEDIRREEGDPIYAVSGRICLNDVSYLAKLSIEQITLKATAEVSVAEALTDAEADRFREQIPEINSAHAAVIETQRRRLGTKRGFITYSACTVHIPEDRYWAVDGLPGYYINMGGTIGPPQLTGERTMCASMTPVLREFVKFVMPAVYPAAAMQLGRNAMQAPLELILQALCE